MARNTRSAAKTVCPISAITQTSIAAKMNLLIITKISLLLSRFRRLDFIPELNDHSTKNNNKQAYPCSWRNIFLEHISPERYTDTRKNSDVNSQQSREVPFQNVHDNAVTAQHDESQHDYGETVSPKPFPDNCIPPDLQNCSTYKNKPSYIGHLHPPIKKYYKID